MQQSLRLSSPSRRLKWVTLMSYDPRILTGVSVMAAVTEAGNFARAAETLGITPSGVSRAIARLEQRVGVRLFDRSPRAVTLTEEGQRFHAQLIPLLASIEEIATEVGGTAETVSGRLRANVDPWFARMVLAQRLPQFTARHPRVTLELTTSNHREEMMNGADVAVRFGPPDVASLIARKLLETRVITCASPAYLKKHGEPASPSDVAEHACVLFRDPQTGRPFPWEFHRGSEVVEVAVTGALILDDPSVAVAACAAGQGVFQSLEMGLSPWLESGQLVQILTGWGDERYPLYAYHPSRNLPPAKVRAFLDFIHQIATG
jgi:DNA-binding transcriptional LysR family regulator